MVRLAKTRRIEGAKEVAKDRKSPRPLKALVLSYYDDDKGKPDKARPHIVRTYRVHVADETVKVFDRYMNPHTIEAKKGDLDWSRGSTVGEQIWSDDPERDTPLAIISLSHDEQFGVINPRWTVDVWKLNLTTKKYEKTGEKRVSRTNYANESVEFSNWTVNSPNAFIPRFNIFKPEELQTPVLELWRMEANSPDAKWVDGKAPTLEDLAEKQEEYEKKTAARKARKLTGAATTGDDSAGPTGADDMGDNF